MAQQPRLDTTRLQKIAQAYWESAALMAAVELEIFTALAHGHDTIAGVERAVGISERNAERLLTALTAMTLLARDGARFALTCSASVKDGERYAGRGSIPSRAGQRSAARRASATAGEPSRQYTEFTVTMPGARRDLSIGMARRGAFSRRRLTGRKLLSAAARAPTDRRDWGLPGDVLDLPPVAVVARNISPPTPRPIGPRPRPHQDRVPGVDVVVMASNLPQYEPALIRGRHFRPQGRAARCT